MTITQVSTIDSFGGAALAASKLHDGLNAAGVDSQMLVSLKQRRDPNTAEYRRPGGLLKRALRSAQRRLSERRTNRFHESASTFADGFTSDRAPKGVGMETKLAGSDLINLHWVSGFLDYASFFPRVPIATPVVWSLHDMNAFTGGCHYDNGCGRFTTQCGKCPARVSAQETDLSRTVFLRKKAAFDATPTTRLHIVAASEWMRRTALKSAHFKRFPTHVIPYGVDTGVYAPRDKAAARDVLGIPANAAVVFFLSQNIANQRKGLPDLMEALSALPASAEPFLLSIGDGRPPVEKRFPHRHLASVWNDRLMSLIYSAADVFAITSRQDNLPYALIEAMACGTPIVGYDAGGIPDLVRNNENGLLVPVGAIADLSEAIGRIVRDRSLGVRLGRAGRRLIEDRHTIEIQVQAYKNLYKSILENNAV
jgi:glycosyltransferase involved in cell wall biosynthesis